MEARVTTRIAWLVALVVLLDACGTSAPAGPAPGDAATDAVEDGRDGGPDDAQSMEDAGGPDSAEDAEDATKGSEDVTPDAADLDAGDPGEVAAGSRCGRRRWSRYGRGRPRQRRRRRRRHHRLGRPGRHHAR
jgi:hypothetical protein